MLGAAGVTQRFEGQHTGTDNQAEFQHAEHDSNAVDGFQQHLHNHKKTNKKHLGSLQTSPGFFESLISPPNVTRLWERPQNLDAAQRKSQTLPLSSLLLLRELLNITHSSLLCYEALSAFAISFAFFLFIFLDFMFSYHVTILRSCFPSH